MSQPLRSDGPRVSSFWMLSSFAACFALGAAVSGLGAVKPAPKPAPQDAPTAKQPAVPHWPHWRGPTVDGHAAATATPPLRWSETEGIVWKVALPGLGNSSPIVIGDRIYLTTAIDLEAVPEGESAGPQPGPPNAKHRHEFLVLALNRQTGREIWRRAVTAGVPHEKGHRTASHASPSVVVTKDRVVAFFGSRGLFGLDLKGKLLWSKKFGEMKTLAGFGEGSTPAVHQNTLILQWDEEGPSFVAAFDARDGKELWRTKRSEDSSWGSPLVTVVKGKPQVILTGSGHTRAYGIADGREIWSCAGMSKNPVNSPLVVGGRLYVMNSYKGRVIQALDLAQAKGAVDAKKGLVWESRSDASYVPPPIVIGKRLYYLRDSTGILKCVDTGTGEAPFGAQRLKGVKRLHASPIVAGGRVYFFYRSGKTLVVELGEKVKVLATNTLNDVIDATPAFVGSRIYVRGRSHLYCVESGAK